MRLQVRTAAALTFLLLVPACASETTSSSASGSVTADGTRLVEPGFRTVLRVELRPATSGADSSALAEKYARAAGVQEARGGDQDTLFIFSADATADEIDEVRQALSDEASVEQVNVEHRK